MALNGSTVLLEVNMGTDEAPDFEVLPCQASFELSGSATPIDTSCKDTAPAGTNIPGRLTWTLSVSYNPDAFPEFEASPTTVQNACFHAFNTGVQIDGSVDVSGVGWCTFTASITSYNLSANDQERVGVELELAISGALVPAEES